MTAPDRLTRLLAVRRVRERQALRSLAAAVRTADAMAALDGRIAALLAVPGPAGAVGAGEWAAAAAGRERLRGVRAEVAARGDAALAALVSAGQAHAAAVAAADTVAARVADAVAAAADAP